MTTRHGLLRVCHLIKGLGRGGAERLLPLLTRGAGPAFGHSVGYFLPWKDALIEELEEIGAPVRCFGCKSTPAMFSRVGAVGRWLQEQEADLLHCHLPLAGVVGRLAGRSVGLPVVYTEHNLQGRYRALTRWANRSTWRLQQTVVAVSQEVADSIAGSIHSRVPVRVIRNGIDARRFTASPEAREATRRLLDVVPDAPLIGTVAVLRAQKRLDVWLQAARRLSDSMSEARFLIVGDGPLRNELEAMARRLGLRERVQFTGLQEDVAPYLAAMDLFLMSSQFEGLPLALLEAMAAELPVVVTAVGGIPEVVEGGKSGVLVPSGDPQALAECALRLWREPGMREQMGKAARQRVERGFSIERMVAEIEALYEEVLDAHRTVT